ncbi:unnamed protein product [Darwinula stevensoni]|uniref:Uncharacterized protein n=1 Tax=Darwinula stevensoni TaxID=69355 RepID=A0A7R8X4T5_9CRUS|nr:unnamed protein product [Darwinula stevensoni]CAG0884014.1 unnamed protein product [Darwinula stevensoni]
MAACFSRGVVDVNSSEDPHSDVLSLHLSPKCHSEETVATNKKNKSLVDTLPKANDHLVKDVANLDNLDNDNFKSLLEEAYSYRNHSDRHHKSDLFKELLKQAEESDSGEEKIFGQIGKSKRSEGKKKKRKESGSSSNSIAARQSAGGSLQDLAGGNGRKKKGHAPQSGANHSSTTITSGSISTRTREGGSCGNLSKASFETCVPGTGKKRRKRGQAGHSGSLENLTEISENETHGKRRKSKKGRGHVSERGHGGSLEDIRQEEVTPKDKSKEKKKKSEASPPCVSTRTKPGGSLQDVSQGRSARLKKSGSTSSVEFGKARPSESVTIDMGEDADSGVCNRYYGSVNSEDCGCVKELSECEMAGRYTVDAVPRDINELRDLSNASRSYANCEHEPGEGKPLLGDSKVPYQKLVNDCEKTQVDDSLDLPLGMPKSSMELQETVGAVTHVNSQVSNMRSTDYQSVKPFLSDSTSPKCNDQDSIQGRQINSARDHSEKSNLDENGNPMSMTPLPSNTAFSDAFGDQVSAENSGSGLGFHDRKNGKKRKNRQKEKGVANETKSEEISGHRWREDIEEQVRFIESSTSMTPNGKKASNMKVLNKKRTSPKDMSMKKSDEKSESGSDDNDDPKTTSTLKRSNSLGDITSKPEPEVHKSPLSVIDPTSIMNSVDIFYADESSVEFQTVTKKQRRKTHWQGVNAIRPTGSNRSQSHYYNNYSHGWEEPRVMNHPRDVYDLAISHHCNLPRPVKMVTSSVPPSEHSDSSDVESVHSISVNPNGSTYADIAARMKKPSLTSPPSVRTTVSAVVSRKDVSTCTLNDSLTSHGRLLLLNSSLISPQPDQVILPAHMMATSKSPPEVNFLQEEYPSLDEVSGLVGWSKNGKPHPNPQPLSAIARNDNDHGVGKMILRSMMSDGTTQTERRESSSESDSAPTSTQPHEDVPDTPVPPVIIVGMDMNNAMSGVPDLTFGFEVNEELLKKCDSSSHLVPGPDEGDMTEIQWAFLPPPTTDVPSFNLDSVLSFLRQSWSQVEGEYAKAQAALPSSSSSSPEPSITVYHHV